MAYKTKTVLPWRKFPRDALNNPSLRFIINRMEKENRQAVFTLFLALYCEADDDGFVDISDAEFFADQCLMNVETLTVLLSYFEKRQIIEKVGEDIPIYRIVEWLSPYPQGGSAKSAADRQKEYRERKKEEVHKLPVSETPDRQEHTNITPHEKETESVPCAESIAITDEMNADICELIKKGEQLTDDELIARIVLYKDAIKKGLSRKEAREAAENAERAVSDEAEKESTSEKSSEHAACSEETVTPSVAGGVTDRNATVTLRNAAVTLRAKIREEEGEREQEGERHRDANREAEGEKEQEREERKAEKQKQKEKPEKREAEQVSKAQSDQTAGDEGEREGKEGVESEAAVKYLSNTSWVTALWQSVSRDTDDDSGADEQNNPKRAHFEALLSSHFKKTGGPLYSESDQEKAALRFLSMFLLPLVDKRNSAEVLASQFTGVLNNFLKKGVFLGYEKCTARTLCSSYIFEPVFLKVERILQAKTGGGARWTQNLISCLKHLKAAEYAVMGIDSG